MSKHISRFNIIRQTSTKFHPETGHEGPWGGAGVSRRIGLLIL